MAAITLLQPCLYHPPSDRLLMLLFVGERTVAFQVPGQFRRYAGGRVRLIRQVGVSRGVSADYRVDAAGLTLLQQWASQLVLYRDGLGTKQWGSYLSASPSPGPDGRHFTVPIEFVELTYDESA